MNDDPKPEREPPAPPPTEEMKRNVRDYANDLRELIKRIRKQMQ